MIQDGCKIGQKGFGFIPLKDKNLKFPHIGCVLIDDNVEIASDAQLTEALLIIRKLEKIHIWIIKFIWHIM